jgi:hypothetical protein
MMQFIYPPLPFLYRVLQSVIRHCTILYVRMTVPLLVVMYTSVDYLCDSVRSVVVTPLADFSDITCIMSYMCTCNYCVFVFFCLSNFIHICY